MPARRITCRSGWVRVLASSSRSDWRKVACHSTRRLQAKTCGAVSVVARQDGCRSDSARPTRFAPLQRRRQKIVCPLGDKWFLWCVFKSAKGFGLGIPVDRVEDPVVPSVLLHDAFLQGWTASSLSKASSKVPSASDSINCNGSFRGRHHEGD